MDKRQARKQLIETIKTIVITTFVAGSIGLVAGYFSGIELHSQARSNVIKDIQVSQESVKKDNQ